MESSKETAGPSPARRSTVSWILYDLANTIFSFVVLSFYFGPWVTAELGAADSAIGLTQSATMVIVLLISPIVGALSDRTRRIPFLIASTIVAVVCTMLLGLGGFLDLSAGSTIVVAIAFYAVANIGFQVGLVLYDALLPAVSTPETIGRIGGLGVGIGYLGSFVGLVLATAILSNNADAEPTLFFATGLAFLIFALPAFFFVRERRRPASQEGVPIKAAFLAVARTVRRLPSNRPVAWFLVARILYADAINTFILFLGVYAASEAGIATESLTYTALLGLSIAFAVLGTPVWGYLVDQVGPRATLSTVLVWWVMTLSLVVFHALFGLPQGVFFLVGPMAGIGLGGTWTADRPLLVALAPAGQVGEFFGLYAMAGRFAAVMGPALWALVVDGLKWGRASAVGILSLFILASWFALRMVPDVTVGRTEVPDTPPPPPQPL